LNQSSVYATFNYEPKDLQAADLVKVILYLLSLKLALYIHSFHFNSWQVRISINDNPCDPLFFIAHSTKSLASTKVLCETLKDVISRQQSRLILAVKYVHCDDDILPYYYRDNHLHFRSTCFSSKRYHNIYHYNLLYMHYLLLLYTCIMYHISCYDITYH
jgi:hypothetical protein